MTETSLVLLVIAVVVSIVVGAAVVEAAGTDSNQIVEPAEAYCEQVYGDEDVYYAMVVGNHGGLHCVANQYGPHLHEIPQKYLDRAHAADMHNKNLGWTLETASQQAADKPDEIPLLGVTLSEAIPLFGVAGIIVGAAVVVGLVQQVRRDSGE